MKLKRFIASIATVVLFAGVIGTDVSTVAAAAPAGGELTQEFLDENGLEYNAETDSYRFKETRTISVEVFDRGLDNGKTKPEDNEWAKWIQEGILAEHNIEVVFKPVDRWDEGNQINNLLAAENAPDICYSYDYTTVLNYAGMGAIIDLAPYFTEENPLTEAIWGWLGDRFINWDKNPDTGVLWALESRRAEEANVNTFVRSDWLEKLDIPAPTNLGEFYEMICAFRDNAETLLGEDADKIIPFYLTWDVPYNLGLLRYSFVPDDITDKERYIWGFDTAMLFPDTEGNLGGAAKKSLGIANKWYHEDLIWKDFALYKSGDLTGENLIKAGYVGAMIAGTWDYPYRDGDNGITGSLHKIVGPEANYIAIDTFLNDAGNYKKDLLVTASDRKIYFPYTNDEPVASIMYLNWITRPEVIEFLQIGYEGKTHVIAENGGIQNISGQNGSDMAWIQNSNLNIDYTMLSNGMNLSDPELTIKSLALSKQGVDPQLVSDAYSLAIKDAYAGKKVTVSEIESERGQATPLKDKKDTLFAKVVTADPANWEKVFDDGLKDWLSSGGQAIIDERIEKFDHYYPGVTNFE